MNGEAEALKALVDSQNVYRLWTVGAVLLGFQMAALAWRLKRELRMMALCELTWLTWADRMVYLSVVVLVVGVFIAPVLGDVPSDWVAWLLGLALIIFAATPPVIAAHYELYGAPHRPSTRPPVTTQEKQALGVVWTFIVAYFAAGLVVLLVT